MPQLALALTTVIWAATFPATKLALEQVLPLSFLFLRFLISSLVLVAVLILARRPIGRTAETLRTAAIASVFLFLGYVTQTVGMRYTTASNSARSEEHTSELQSPYDLVCRLLLSLALLPLHSFPTRRSSDLLVPVPAVPHQQSRAGRRAYPGEAAHWADGRDPADGCDCFRLPVPRVRHPDCRHALYHGVELGFHHRAVRRAGPALPAPV